MARKHRDPLPDALLHRLSELRSQQAGPFTLSELALDLTPPPPVEALLQAVHNRAFTRQTVVVFNNDLNALIALKDDLNALAESDRLLHMLIDRLDPNRPLYKAADLAKPLPSALKKPFLAALTRRVAEGRLPEPLCLHKPGWAPVFTHRDRPPPPPPAVALAERLVRTLVTLRGSADYPPTLHELLRRCEAVEGALLKSALARPEFQSRVLLAARNNREAPVSLMDDAASLARSRAVLLFTLESCRNPKADAFTAKELSVKLTKSLKPQLIEWLEHLDAPSIPPGIGTLRVKGKRMYFRLKDVQMSIATSLSVPPARETTTHNRVGVPFDAAFQRLDAKNPIRNFVSLVDLRRELADVPRDVFDGELRSQCRQHRYRLSVAEGLQGLTEDQRAAAFHENGEWYLHVSRVNS